MDTATVAIILYITSGCFAGFSAGLLGIGGGLIIVPVLFFVFTSLAYETHYLMHMALATSLATITLTSISSTLAHHKKKAVLWPLVVKLSPAIAAGAWLGAMLASHLDTTLLKPLFGIFEIFVAGLMFSAYQSKKHHQSITPISNVIGGSLIGGLSAIFGIGGGTLTVPFLHWHNISIKNAIATSAACGLPISFFATASYIFNSPAMSSELTGTLFSTNNAFGFVQLDAFFLIAASSFICAPIGAITAHKIPGQLLKKIFAGILLLLGVKMLLP